MPQSLQPAALSPRNPADRQRDRYGRLPRRTKPVTASLEPELHQRLSAAVEASGSTLSQWIAEAIELRLRLDTTTIEQAAAAYAQAKAELHELMQEPDYPF